MLRPKELLNKRAAFEKQQCSSAELKAAEDQAVKQAVRLQTDIGFRAASDGEYR